MRIPLLMAALALAPSVASAQDPDPWLGSDKALHLTLSAAIAGAGYGVASLKLDRPGRFAVGATVGLGAGIAKELWDLSGHGDASWKDLTADAVGVIAGLAISFAVDSLVAGLTHPAPAR